MTDLPPAGTLPWLDRYTDMGGRILAEIGCTPEQIAAFGAAWEERCWPLLAEAEDEAVTAGRLQAAEAIDEFGAETEARAARHAAELSVCANRANAAVAGAYEMAAWIATGRNRRNVHCATCGDLRGGPMGHETSECAWVDPETRIRQAAEAVVVACGEAERQTGELRVLQRAMAEQAALVCAQDAVVEAAKAWRTAPRSSINTADHVLIAAIDQMAAQTGDGTPTDGWAEDIDMEPVYEAAARAEIDLDGPYSPPFTDAELDRVAKRRAQYDGLRAHVDAARPLIEAAVREQVAQAIEAEHERIRPHDMRPYEGLVGMATGAAYRNAARIAEGP